MSFDAIDDLLAHCLEKGDAQSAAAVEECCTRHPELAPELRRRFATLMQLGLVEIPLAGLPHRFGKYRIQRELGQGAMGRVFVACDTELERSVVLKTIRPDHIPYPGARERFRREMLAASRIEHAAICPVYEAGDLDGIPYIAMPFIAENTMADWLRADGMASLGPPRAQIETLCRWFGILAEGLQAAHDAGFVHRDVKPANILMPEGGHPVLVDFGLARAVETGQDSGLTATGSIVGTPAYMAPEQISNHAEVGPHTDIYALGLCLRECLTGQPAFRATEREALYREILESEIPEPRRLVRSVPADLSLVVGTATAAIATNRYASAREFAQDLWRVRQHESIIARRPPFVLRARRWMQRHPAATSTLVISCVGLCATIWLMVRAMRSADEAQAYRLVQQAAEVQEERPAQALEMLATALKLSEEPIVVARSQEVMHGLESVVPIRPGESAQLSYARWSPDGRYFVCAGLGIDASIYTAKGRWIARIDSTSTPNQGHNLAFLGERVVLGHVDGSVGIYELASNKRHRLLVQGARRGYPVRILADNRTIFVVFHAVGTTRYFARMWSGPSLAELTLEGPADASSFSAALLPDGRPVWGNRVFSPEGRVEQTLDFPDTVAVTASDVRGDKLVLCAGNENPSQVYCYRCSDPLTKLASGSVEQDICSDVAIDRDGRRAVWGTLSGLLQTLRLDGRWTELTSWQSLKGRRIGAVTIDAVSGRTAIGAENGLVEIFDRSGVRIRTLRGHEGPVRSVEFSPRSGDLLLSSAWDGTVRIWDLAHRPSRQVRFGGGKAGRVPGKAEVLVPMPGPTLARFGPNMRELERIELTSPAWYVWVAAGGDAMVSHRGEEFLTELRAGKRLELALGEGNTVLYNRAYRLADGRVLYRRTPRRAVVWTSPDSQKTFGPDGGAGCTSVAASRDGNLVACAYWTTPSRVVLYDLSESELACFAAPGVVHEMEFSPDGHHLAVASTDRAARSFDLDRKEGRPFGVHRGGGVKGVAFSPDGTLLATVAGDGMLRIFDHRTARTVFEVRAHDPSVDGVQFLDDSHVVTTGRDGQAKWWTLDAAEARAEIERIRMREEK